MERIRQIVISNLKRLRESQGMSGNEFAKKCKMQQRTYNRIENGESAPHLDMLELIAAHNELYAWQLLVPNFDPHNRPMLQVPSETEQAFYDRVNYLLNNTQ